MSDPSDLTVSVHRAIAEIGQEAWDACACPEDATGRPIDPFTTYRFLSALEDSGSVGQGTGWVQQYLAVSLKGEIIAVMPAYAKGHSQGEYIFDHNWAHAYENAGGRYYPKLQISVPFTPATGRRFLCKDSHSDLGRRALIDAAKQVVAQNEWSGFHITFCDAEEYEADHGLLKRMGQQFHWQNEGYEDFDGFLATLSSRKRKNLKKERATAQSFGGEIHVLTEAQIKPEHWDAFWQFYQDTGARKWGTPYLTREFFNSAQESLREDIVLYLCKREGQWVAGALNFIGRDTLYGRYWGCLEHHPCLHFELCYYQAIDYAIKHGLKHVEAGAQGEHKLARGYLPVPTYSLHWFANPGFEEAVESYLKAERRAVGEDIEVLTSYGPFKSTKGE